MRSPLWSWVCALVASVPVGVVSLLAVSCAEPAAPNSVVAEVVDLTAIDFEHESASYTIAPRELKTLRNLKHLDGDHVRIRRGGKLIIRQISGSYVSSGEFEDWDKPALRYDVHNGVVIPRDYPTLAMLSAYYQFERIFAELPRVMGDSIETLAPAQGFVALFEPAVVLRGAAESISLSIRGNAAYIGGTGQFALFERSNFERVPFATNQVVLAHEFGHWVFDTAFLHNDTMTCDENAAEANSANKLFPGRLDTEYAIAGINEGFADFFSFAVTGLTNPMFDLGSTQAERSIRSTTFLYDWLGDSGVIACKGEFYCIGTLFARSLYESMGLLGLDPANTDDRGAFEQRILAALRGARAVLEANFDALLPAPQGNVAKCELREEIDKVYDGQVASAFLYSVLSGLDEPTRLALCSRLIANFGDSGFTAQGREACVP